MKWLAAFVIVALARPASAEINMADSIEWQTVDSPVVVRGLVTAVTTTKGAGSVSWYDVTIQIAETIKGNVKSPLRVGIRSFGQDIDGLRKSKKEVLLFLVPGSSLTSTDKGYAAYPFALRYSSSSTDNPFVIGTSKAYTTDFKALTDETEVLAVVRAAAKSTATKSHRLDIPWHTPAQRALYGGSVVWMTVPVDAALEKRAIKWLGDADTREEGALALANFKSAANIERMKKLLADPAFAEVTESGKPKMKRYLVRVVADATLTAWGVPHKKPTLEAPAKM
jgi:hypothetical protein